MACDMVQELHQLRFASDATLLALLAAVFLLIAILAWIGDRRRARRKRIDAVGWVPWTGIFFTCLLLASSLLLLALSGWKTG